MKEKSWKGKIKKMMTTGVLMTAVFSGVYLNNTALATSASLEATNDVTPPWGRIRIVGAAEQNGMNYVDGLEVEIQLYAADDICNDEEIKFYVSTTEIPDTQIIADDDWEDYKPAITRKLTLPNLTGTNSIYAVFKDASGNTSLIYNGTDTQYTIQYNTNGGTEIPASVNRIAYFGAPYTVTMQPTEKEGYHFLGWSTSSTATTASYRQGDIIPANAFTGTEKTVNLYAVWTQDVGELPLLADVVKVGDYVNYPVYYDNVRNTTYTGWRVISKDIDLDGKDSPGTVNLISGGIPLTYLHPNATNSNVTSVTALTTNFLTTEFGTTNYTYRKTGFAPYKSLSAVFTNEFTAMNGTAPKVRAMLKEDIMRITGDETWSSSISLTKAEYQNLFQVGDWYWLASAGESTTYNMWYVNNNGGIVSSNNGENGVRPVVSLKSTVKAVDTNFIGIWNIEI